MCHLRASPVTPVERLVRLVLRRAAQLRFGQPYAVAAVAADAGGSGAPGLWPGVPVFSAWVTDPQDAAGETEAGPESRPGAGPQ
jgi:hypothetical protein